MFKRHKKTTWVYLFPVDKEQSERNNEWISSQTKIKKERKKYRMVLSIGIPLIHSSIKRTEFGPECFFTRKYIDIVTTRKEGKRKPIFKNHSMWNVKSDDSIIIWSQRRFPVGVVIVTRYRYPMYSIYICDTYVCMCFGILNDNIIQWTNSDKVMLSW